MFQLPAALLAFFYSITHSYALMILLFTLTVMALLTPFTIKSTRSMLEMQRLAPEIKKLQAKYKNDKQAMNEAMMAFYSEHGVSPLGGCLPILLQMPVFLIVNVLLRGLLKLHGAGSTFNPATVVMRLQGVDSAGQVTRTFQPKYVKSSSRLYESLLGKTEMNSFGVDLAKSARFALKVDGFTKALPYVTLLLVMVLLGLYAQRQISARNPQAAQANPQAQLIGKVFPVIFGVISFGFFAGLVLYWTIQSGFRVIQQGAMYKWDPKIRHHVETERKELVAKEQDIRAGIREADPKPKGFFAQLKDAAGDSATQTNSASGRANGTGSRPGGTNKGGAAAGGGAGGAGGSAAGGSRSAAGTNRGGGAAARKAGPSGGAKPGNGKPGGPQAGNGSG